MLRYKHWQMDKYILIWIYKVEMPLTQILYVLCTMCLDKKETKLIKMSKTAAMIILFNFLY